MKQSFFVLMVIKIMLGAWDTLKAKVEIRIFHILFLVVTENINVQRLPDWDHEAFLF